MKTPENTRGTVHTRKVPRVRDDTGRLEAIRAPPTEAYRELAKAGLMPIAGPRIVTTWCLCGHQLGAHPDDGPCQAKACRKFADGCIAYRQDPKYLLEGPSKGYAVGTGTIVQTDGDEPGKMHLSFQRDRPPEAKPP